MIGGRTQVTPEEAERIPPDTVRRLASAAEKQDPSVVDKISQFYAQHPTVVKALGAGALGSALSKLTGRLTGQSR